MEGRKILIKKLKKKGVTYVVFYVFPTFLMASGTIRTASCAGIADDKAGTVRGLDPVELEILEVGLEVLLIDYVNAIGIGDHVIFLLFHVERGGVLGPAARVTGEVDADQVVGFLLFFKQGL